MGTETEIGLGSRHENGSQSRGQEENIVIDGSALTMPKTGRKSGHLLVESDGCHSAVSAKCNAAAPEAKRVPGRVLRRCEVVS